MAAKASSIVLGNHDASDNTDTIFDLDSLSRASLSLPTSSDFVSSYRQGAC